MTLKEFQQNFSDAIFQENKDLKAELDDMLLKRKERLGERHWLNKYLFVNDFLRGKKNPRSIQYLVQKAGIKSGLSKIKGKITPHSFRRSFATNLSR